MIPKVASLFDLYTLHDYDPNAMSVEQACQFIRQFLVPITGQEPVPLHTAWQRTLASDVISPVHVPPHDYSAMDGYAVRAVDCVQGTEVLKIIGSSYAGHMFEGSMEKGECVRIMTGALIPDGCDSVVMQEHITVAGDTVVLNKNVRAGQNIRRAGEDIQQGALVLARGRAIRAAEMGMLASLGLSEVRVYRKLKVAIFSTGDELQQPGTPLLAGQIYDSNRFTLMGLLAGPGVEIIDLGNIRDDQAMLKQAMLDAAQQADVIITSGGVSVGEADYIKQLLAEIGEVVFWKIAMKPGRPLAYGKIRAAGKIDSSHFFGLPGNPVAVMVTFQQFVRDALLTLMGQQPKPAFTLQARCTSPIKKIPGRTEFQRGIVSQTADGEWTVQTTGEQGSGILSSMSKANCFIVLATDQGDVAAGAMVEVQMI
ncbi:MAG: gephyrin-like molybdotransferase Glp [Candidatus Nitrotoga sp.]